jgi:murein DD-endopeptidase MepM/ murein hydrolase activator NlpD
MQGNGIMCTALKLNIISISNFSMVNIKWGFALIGLFVTGNTNAQIFAPKTYPQQYFAWPVQAQKALAANFGELRPNHYHMGLDCKTNQRENLPLIAAAAGYIAKIKIEPYGFGRAIYINHPNGLTTLYAHCNDFFPALEQYVKQEQYKLQSWRLFIDIPPHLFPVQKGQFIAYSGNTGGSQGPHLHFEIRDTQTDKVLNPLLFGFGLSDNVAPDILRLAIYDRSKSIYEQSPRFVPLKKINGSYVTVPATVTVPFTNVSFAITAYDRYSGSTNQNGIFGATMYANEKAICGFELDSISYNETRYLNAHIDYRLKSSGGPYVQHLSRMPGYPPGVYKTVGETDILSLDTSPIAIKIKAYDTEYNSSILNFAIKTNTTQATNTPNNSGKIFKPHFENIYEDEQLCVYLPQNFLYDAVHFKCTPLAGKPAGRAFQLLGGHVPVHSYFPIAFKNVKSTQPQKLIVHRWWGGKDDYAKAIAFGNWYVARFKALGNVEIYEDEDPPVIKPVGFSNGINAAKLKRIVFVITDNSEEIVNFKATLDGNWLRFSNDKGKTFIYYFDEKCGSGQHELIISAEDLAGNVTTKTYQFVR